MTRFHKRALFHESSNHVFAAAVNLLKIAHPSDHAQIKTLTKRLEIRSVFLLYNEDIIAELDNFVDLASKLATQGLKWMMPHRLAYPSTQIAKEKFYDNIEKINCIRKNSNKHTLLIDKLKLTAFDFNLYFYITDSNRKAIKNFEALQAKCISYSLLEGYDYEAIINDFKELELAIDDALHLIKKLDLSLDAIQEIKYYDDHLEFFKELLLDLEATLMLDGPEKG